MAFEMRQVLSQQLALVMTPQLQQAIKLLQLSRTELNDALAQEMIENPTLEDVIDTGRERDAATLAERARTAPESSGVDGPSLTTAGAKERVDVENATAADWEQYLGGFGTSGSQASGSRDRGGDDLPSYEATASKRSSLNDHLMWQLRLTDFDARDEAVAALLLGSLDDDGYLKDPLEDLARREGIDAAVAERVLLRMQLFDPPGVCARSLEECLLLQLKELAGDWDFDLVEAIIKGHIRNLERKNYAAIARDLHVTLAEVHAATKVIQELEPKPGRPFASEDTHYVLPDVFVRRVGTELVVSLNDDGLPKLKISSFYKDQLAREGTSAQAKGYIQDKLKSALWLIKSIQQRQRTIYRVTESIVKFQAEFFEKGISHLKPMVLRDVAEDIGMHESTISRVTTNKYVHCPQGLLELKYFFNAGINRVDGDALASESVKQRIKDVVGGEDRQHPLSDQRIVEILKEGNIDIARRTVAKYREALGLLSSSKRRELA